MKTMRVMMIAAIAAFVSSCQPFAELGDPCGDAPCAVGLLCTAGRCETPPPPPPPPCQVDDDCHINGDASGRVCTDGTCGWASCTLDLQCAGRDCVDGRCAEVVACVVPTDCEPGQVCTNNECTDGCASDDDCPSIGTFGQACIDQVCVTRCDVLGDFVCFGGICVDGLCAPAECNNDAECVGEDQRCDNNRCEAFVRCEENDDCFDVNLFCDFSSGEGQCEDRARCTVDVDCNNEQLCLNGVCRDTASCASDDDCPDENGDDRECVLDRCVRAPMCRQPSDCGGDEGCAGGVCVALPAPTGAEHLYAADDLGACGVGRSACHRVLYVGETLELRLAGVAADGTSVRPDAVVQAPVEVEASVASGLLTMRALAVLTIGSITIEAGGEPLAMAITVVPRASAQPQLVLYDEDDGRPMANASIDIYAHDDAPIASTSDGSGVVLLPAELLGLPVTVAVRGSSRSFITTISSLSVDTRLGVTKRVAVLARANRSDASSLATGAITIASSGDEVGPVGVGIAVPSVASSIELSLGWLSGGVVAAAVSIPVLGSLPVNLSENTVLSASLPTLGDQVVRAAAEWSTHAGPLWSLVLEGRQEQQQLINFVLGQDPAALARTLAQQSEGLDAELASLGVSAGAPLVDDELDRDGDGNTTEQVPDWYAATVATITPSRGPNARYGLLRSDDNEAVVVMAIDSPGALIPLGVTLAGGGSQQVKAVPAPAARSRDPLWMTVTATATDGLQQRRLLADRAVVEVAPLPALPAGAFVLRNVPAVGQRTLVLPIDVGTHLVETRWRDDAGLLWVWWVRGDQSVLPMALPDDVRLEEVAVWQINEPRSDAQPFSVEQTATAVAASLGG
jgi:hypothetical protein